MKFIKKMVRNLYKRMWKEEWPVYVDMYAHYPWVYDKKEFFKSFEENPVSISKRLEKAKIGLDTKSIDVLEKAVAKCMFFYYTDKIKDILYVKTGEQHFLHRILDKKVIKIINEKYANKLPIDFYESSVFYYHCGLTEVPQCVLEYIKNKDFVDGGACFGDSPLVLSEYSPNKIYAFEPVKSNIELMEQTIALNKLQDTVIPVKFGIGDKDEETKISIEECAMLPQITNSLSINSENISITTIDKYCSENNLNCGLIKMDLEGYEMKALRGAKNTIKKNRPVLLISAYHSMEDFFEIKEYIENLNLNYKFMYRSLKALDTIVDVMLIAYPQELED